MKMCFFSLPATVFVVYAFLSPIPMQALLLDFDTDYTAGTYLDGQPTAGTQWSGGGNDFMLVEKSGVDHSIALVTANRNNGSAETLFAPDSTDLPDFDAASSVLEISFQYRFEEAPVWDTGKENVSTVAVVQCGYNGNEKEAAAVFLIRSNGEILFYNADKSILISAFTAEDNTTWFTVSARLDYAQQTYTFSINGTPYVTGGGTSAFKFRGNTDSANFRIRNQGSPHHKKIIFDNITMTLQ